MTSKRALGASVALGLSLFAVHAVHRVRQPLTLDDAYMVLRYAKQIIAGHGHAWNPDGVQVFGATGSLHLGLVTLLEWLLPLPDSHVVSLASVLFALLGLAALARVSVLLLRSRLRERPWLVTAGVLLLVLPQRLFISQAFSGMDAVSALFANSLVGGAALWLGRTGSTRALCAAVGAALLAILARPDDGLYAVLTPAIAVALGGPRPRLPLLLKLGAALAVMLAAYLGVATLIFGDPLPLPFYAKSVGYFAEYSAARAWNPFEYLGLILAMWLPALFVIVFGVTRRTAAEVIALLAPVALTFTYYFSVVQIMGVGARYYVPATPFAVLAALVVLDDLFARADGGAETLRALALRWPLALALSVGAPTVLHDAETLYGVQPSDQLPTFPATCYERPAVGLLPPASYDEIIAELGQLLSHSPPGLRVALSEHGRIGAAAPQVFLDDLIALHDPEFAHHGFDADVELARKPDAIWMPHYFFVQVWHDLVANPRLWADYDVWPDAFLFGFAIRRDSPHHDELTRGFGAIWQRVYPSEDIDAWRARRLRSELPQCRRESRVAPIGGQKATR
jgi:hypothetical protein